MNVAAILQDKGRNVLTVDQDTPIIDVAKLIDEHRIGSVVIVNESGQLAGIVTERDIVKNISRRGCASLNDPVSTCMTSEVVTCTRADTVEYLMEKMTTRRFRHLPVVENNELLGIVSIGDVVKQRVAEVAMEATALREYIATG